MPYVFRDDGQPEADEFANNYVWMDERARERGADPEMQSRQNAGGTPQGGGPAPGRPGRQTRGPRTYHFKAPASTESRQAGASLRTAVTRAQAWLRAAFAPVKFGQTPVSPR